MAEKKRRKEWHKTIAKNDRKRQKDYGEKLKKP